MRFHATLSDSRVQGHGGELKLKEALGFGAHLGGVLRGASELVEIRGGRDCEIALSVEEAYQHLAIGRILMAALLVAAASLGLERLKLEFLPDNVRMRNLARDFGARVTPSRNIADAEIAILRHSPPRSRSPEAAS